MFPYLTADRGTPAPDLTVFVRGDSGEAGDLHVP